MRAYITPLSISATLLIGLAKVLSQANIAPPQDQVWISGTPMSHAEVTQILSQSGASLTRTDLEQVKTSDALTSSVIHKTGQSLTQFMVELKGDR